MIRTSIIGAENSRDINIPNEPFPLNGRMIPSLSVSMPAAAPFSTRMRRAATDKRVSAPARFAARRNASRTSDALPFMGK